MRNYFTIYSLGKYPPALRVDFCRGSPLPELIRNARTWASSRFFIRHHKKLPHTTLKLNYSEHFCKAIKKVEKQ